MTERRDPTRPDRRATGGGRRLTDPPPATVDRLHESDAALRGRWAFWSNVEIWANPHVERLADSWRRGWKMGLTEFRRLGGRLSSKRKDLARLKPNDVPATMPMWKRLTKRGVAKRRADNLKRMGMAL